ncbi:ankyrin repeat domain-containing protein [Candidatus Dependentiae bacterium]|nr:ankyrin repeat domain-containing protein [Candidatus Dependentiae bacterium]
MKKYLGLILLVTVNICAMDSNPSYNAEFSELLQLPQVLKEEILMTRVLSDIQTLNPYGFSPFSAKQDRKEVIIPLYRYFINKEFKAILEKPENVRKIVETFKAKFGDDFILTLIPAASVGLIALLLKGGIDPNAAYRSQDSAASNKFGLGNPDKVEYALTEAARANRADIVKLLLENGVNAKVRATVPGKPRLTQTALEIAANEGYPLVVEALLAHSNYTQQDKQDALRALELGKTSMEIQARSFGRDPKKEQAFNTIIELLTDKPIAKETLLVKKVLSDIQDFNHYPLYVQQNIQRSQGQENEIIPLSKYFMDKDFKFILEKPENASKIIDAFKAKIGDDFILRLIPSASVGLISLLLKGGIDPNTAYRSKDLGASDKLGLGNPDKVEYALTEAARANRADLVKLLLENGANATIRATVPGKPRLTQTALEIAANEGHPLVVEALLAHSNYTQQDKQDALRALELGKTSMEMTARSFGRDLKKEQAFNTIIGLLTDKPKG